MACRKRYDVEKAERRQHFTVRSGDTAWTFENEDEFYQEYRLPSTTEAVFGLMPDRFQLQVQYFYKGDTGVDVALPSLPQIERVFESFEAAREACLIPTPRPRPLIFIGHERDVAWRDLKDHLHEKQGFEVRAYETGARAGYSITEFLEHCQRDAGFALLVHSDEDEDPSGALHARENVVHETGLFQGRLGFQRAIVLREDGCKQFSNLAGVQEIGYPKDGIRETFGEVLATLRRGIPEADPGRLPSARTG
ncbi:MAG TPA: TIR domain-containing protein [Bryobacteraceae bacterium]|nr:TIR domain-containing protein [Bryobacteraceae bacterium]